MFLLKLSLRPWKLAPFSQAFSALAVGLLLLLAGFLFWIQHGLKPVLTRLHHEQVITAFLDPVVEEQEEGQVVDSIRSAVGAHPATEISFSDSKQAIASISSDYPELGRELEELGDEARTVVPRYVTISGILPDSTLHAVREVRGIESADSSKDRYRHVAAAFSALRWVAKLLVLGLAIALLTGLIHLSRMNAYFHRDAISLMRLWGASESLLRVPGLFSGLFVGCVGGLIAGLSWLSGGMWLSRHIRSLSPLLRDMALLPSYFPVLLFLAGALVGLFAGMLGGGLGWGPAATDRRG